MAWLYITLACLISVVAAQVDQMTLPPELQQKLNDSQIEAVKDKYKQEFKNKCTGNGHPEVYDNIEESIQRFTTCVTSLIDVNTLNQEIEDAKPTGRVDEVFKKYCNKSPELKACFRNMTEYVKPCFKPEEQKNFKTLYNVTDQLSEFICYKDGDRIALFIAEGGMECFQEKQEAVQNCFNSTFDSETQGTIQNISMEGIFDLEFKEKQCNQMTALQTCIVNALDSCSRPTSSNIVDSLFNFVRKDTPCKKYNKVDPKNSGQSPKTKSGASNGVAVTMGTLLMAVITVLIV